MTLQITSPTGITKVVKAENDQDKAYYLKWVAKGFTVKEMPRVHVSGSTCTACEG